jgi:diguanylate cyclase (GGDEF)-like protein
MKIKNMQYNNNCIFVIEYDEIKEKKISDVSRLFTKNSKDILVITKNLRPYHVLTSTDIIDALIAHDDNLNIETYIDKNPKSVITICENETVFEAYKLMRSYRIHHLVIVDEKGLFKSVINFYDFASYLTEIALKDEMTGLYNKRFFEFILDRYKKEDIEIGVVFIDLDGFKKINDIYGHMFGDRVIKEVASIIKKLIRDIDYAFRFGGDEFVVIIFGDVNALETVAGRILNTVSSTKLEDVRLKCSVGFAHCPADASNLEDVLKLADERMYENKKIKK